MPVITDEVVVYYLHDLPLPVPLWSQRHIAATLMNQAVMVSPKVLIVNRAHMQTDVPDFFSGRTVTTLKFLAELNVDHAQYSQP
jgi:hypothetical protein